MRNSLAFLYHRAQARYVCGYLKQADELNGVLHPDVHRLAAKDVFKRVPFIVKREPQLTLRLLTYLVKVAPDEQSSLSPVLAQSMMVLPELVASTLPPRLQQAEGVVEQDNYAPSLFLRSVSQKFGYLPEFLDGVQGYGASNHYLTVAYTPISRLTNHYIFTVSQKGKPMLVVTPDFAAAGKENTLLACEMYCDVAAHKVCMKLVDNASALEKDFTKALPLPEAVQFRITRARYKERGITV